MADAYILPRRPTTTLLLGALRAALAITQSPVGLSAAPRNQGTGGKQVLAPAPYGILYPLYVSDLGGPTWGAERHTDATWTYQVSLFSTSGDQLEWMRDLVLALMLGKTDAGGYSTSLDTSTARIMERDLRDDTGIGESSGSDIVPTDLRFGLLATRPTA